MVNTTPEQRQRIQALAADGLSHRQIAELVGCSRSAARRWRTGEPPADRHRVDVEMLDRLIDERRPAPVIAEQIGCSIRTVQRRRRERGLAVTASEYSSRPLTPERRARIAQLVENGYSVQEICKTLHVNSRTIARHFPEAGWSMQQRVEYRTMLRRLEQLPTRLDEIIAQRAALGLAA